MIERLLRLLARPGLPLLLALCSFLLALPALTQGLYSDDWLHRMVLFGGGPFLAGDQPLLDFFAFIKLDEPHSRVWAEYGLAPWWTDPELQIALLRPLSALTQILDYRLFGEHFALHHLHSLLWAAFGVLAVSALYRRIYREEAGLPVTAGLAALLYALDDAHAFPSAWLANRNALITVVFGALGFLAHVRWRREGRHRDLAHALLFLGLGLCAGEGTLGAMAYLGAWQLILDKGGWRRRLTGLLPVLVLLAAWRLGYDALGFGTWNSGVYLDPVHSPRIWLQALLERLPLLFATGWTQFSADVYLVLPRDSQLAMSGLSFLVLLLVLGFFLPLLKWSPIARFWALGSIFSLLPVSAALPMERLLGWFGLGAFGMLACQVQALGWLGQPAVDSPRITRSWRRLLTGLLLVLHLPWAAFLYPLKVAGAPMVWQLFDFVEEQLPKDPAIQGKTLILVQSQDLLTADIALMRAGEGGPLPRRIAPLCSLLSPAELERTDERTLKIKVEGGWMHESFDRLFRDPSRPFTRDQLIRMPDFEVRVLELTAEGRPQSVEFRFDLPLDDDRLLWMSVGEKGLTPFEIPGIGERVTLEALSLASVEASMKAEKARLEVGGSAIP